MGGRFRASRGGVSVSFTEVEVTVLRQLLGELLELLATRDDGEAADPLAAMVGIGTETRRPEDPALARLFPDAYRDDPDAASDFRRYTEASLRERKTAAARTALATLDDGPGRRTLDRGAAVAWLGTLNDLRLAMGERLHITEDWEADLADLAEDDPRAYAVAVYDLLTMMQDSLVHALD
ncbi:DUF2017 domain-containing protein [Vallicoccus soli]|uniref:DUF2017 domain-containing protein n=1 Tax=Vallicoccus soli TaxID=2339232 RepID=A0A3A3YZI2_9ACTN|nr:DUF2017 domain-containing protein [Vallicoccus soli]RJK97160.1 DUF2017 domain-containing protein [Vallicoccus soli]